MNPVPYGTIARWLVRSLYVVVAVFSVFIIVKSFNVSIREAKVQGYMTGCTDVIGRLLSASGVKADMVQLNSFCHSRAEEVYDGQK